MKKFKVLVSGCDGRMGKLVCSAVNSSDDMYVIAGIDKVSRDEETFKIYSPDPNTNCYPIFEELENNSNLPDIIIDFSSPTLSRNVTRIAKEFQIPIVVATTGLDENYIYLLKTHHSKKSPVFQAANMSFDVTLFKNIVQLVAKQLNNVDIEISETHHNRKADAPSGTAKMLADAVNEALGNSKTVIYGREGKRNTNEIGISSIRGGNVTGEHTVQFFGEEETLEIKHISYSPKIYADGAVKAARFLLTKENGFYNMDDLISL